MTQSKQGTECTANELFHRNVKVANNYPEARRFQLLSLPPLLPPPPYLTGVKVWVMRLGSRFRACCVMPPPFRSRPNPIPPFDKDIASCVADEALPVKRRCRGVFFEGGSCVAAGCQAPAVAGSCLLNRAMTAPRCEILSLGICQRACTLFCRCF